MSDKMDVLAVMDAACQTIARAYGDELAAMNLHEARAAVAELVEDGHLSVEALNTAADAIGGDLGFLLRERARFLSATLAKFGGA